MDENKTAAAAVRSKSRKTAEQQNTDASSINIPVVEEKLNVERQVVEKGKVRIRKRVARKSELLDVPEIHENVRVERIPINRLIETAPPPIRYEGSTMIIPVLREEIVVTKRLVLVEELHVNKEQVEVHNPQEIGLLKEEIEIERTA
jgi:uncharacterized protein (TIGR02271 family)